MSSSSPFYLFFAAYGLVLGVFVFYILARQNPAYLRGVREHLRFFFSPFGPVLMIVIKELDNSISILYKHSLEKRDKEEVRIYRGSRGVIIESPAGLFVSPVDPREGQLVSIMDARGPVGSPSPFGYGWRLLTGWLVAWIFAWIGFVNTFIDAWLAGRDFSGVDWLMFMWLVLVFYTMFAYIIPRLYAHQIRLSGFIEVGYNPPYRVLAPSCSPWDSTTVDECTRYYGGKLIVKVPESLKAYFDELRKEHGSYSLAAALAARLDESVQARKTISELKRRMYEQTEAAKSLIRIEGFRYLTRLTIPKVLFWGLLLAIGFGLGYMFGSDWALSTQPPPWYAHTNTSMYTQTQVYVPVQPAQPPNPPMASQPPVQPAKPPPPPTVTVTITPARPPSTGNTTV